MAKKKQFIDLFAGAGGFGLGFQLAGLDPILSVEIDKFAVETLKANNNHKILQRNLNSFSDKTNILSSIDNKEVNVIVGGPPCQGFSNAASSRVAKFDERNKLVFKFMNWVKYCEPDVFVIENVSGIETKFDFDGVKIIDKILDTSKKYGYNIQLWKLNAADFGVPQYRKRTFIIGIRGVNSTLALPRETHSNAEDLAALGEKEKVKHLTVGEAILDLPYILAKEGSEVQNYNHERKDLSEYQLWAMNDSQFVFNHAAMHHTKRLVDRYQLLIDGVSDLPVELKVKERNGGGKLSNSSYNSNYRHLDPNKPSYTVPASFYSSFVHPTIPRNITAREAARIQSFPDNYVFKGKRTLISKKLLIRNGRSDEIGLSQYNQIGNAVPPLLSRAIGRNINSQI